MNEKLKEYLLGMKFTEQDISFLLRNEDLLNYVEFESAMKNIELVVSAGFPLAEIDSLIFNNPAFLTRSEDEMIESLEKIDGDIETALIDDPFLI